MGDIAKIKEVEDALDDKQHCEEVKFILSHCEEWSKRGIHKILCHYSGRGDSGAIDDFSINGGESPWSGDTTIITDEVEEAFTGLTFHQADYNGDGGGGYIEVDVDNYTVKRSEFNYEMIHKDFPTEEL